MGLRYYQERMEHFHTLASEFFLGKSLLLFGIFPHISAN